jgi:signal transduction histidine kinase
LIDDLRTLSLAESGALPLHLEPADLGELAREATSGFEPQAAASGVTLAVDAADDLPDLELDPRRIRQVVANLVSNALRHTPRGGEVRVAARRTPSGAELEVRDTGSGMGAEAAAHAFDRFWRAGESSGAGLGLAIVRDLVVAHGGDVQLVSAPGEGTSVRISFPA